MTLVVLAGCGGNTKDEATNPTEPPTTQPRDLQAEVLAAYRANWAAFISAGDPPNPQHPALLDTKTGSALVAAQQGLSDLQERGWVGRGGVELRPRVLTVTTGRAEVEDCVLNRSQVLDGATGRVIEEPAGVPKRWTAVLLFVDDRWKTEKMKMEGQC